MWWQMNSLLSRLSDWVVAHPVLWAVGLGVVLVVLGVAFQVHPLVVVAVGATLAALNVLHARRRNYCPLPEEQGSRARHVEAE